MLRIGMDRTDRNFRKFEYDDERRYGNPGAEMFKVLYEETGLFGEVLCSNVISIKKSNNEHNRFLDIPIYNNVKKDEVSKSKVTLSEDVNELEKILETPIEKKKSKTSSKTKSKTTVLKGETIETKELILDVSNNVSIKPKLYEYDILVVDNISYTDDVKSKLNELGKDGWEVCGFQMNQRIFGGGCQAVIIMKKGLN
jgi:hypothetical protein